MAWVVAGVSFKGIALKSTTHEAIGQMALQDPVGFYSLGIGDRTNNAVIILPVARPSQINRALQLYDDPNWPKNPWAVLLAVGSLMDEDWLYDEDFVDNAMTNMTFFKSWEAALSAKNPPISTSHRTVRGMLSRLFNSPEFEAQLSRQPSQVAWVLKMLLPFLDPLPDLKKSVKKAIITATSNAL